MFKNLIYFDSNRVADYVAVLEGKKHVAIKNVKVSSGKSLSAKVPILLMTFYNVKKLTEPFVRNLTGILTERKGKPILSLASPSPKY
ncbi:hypothetical protein V7150_10580 [Neobacillus drentensis]|uniref:hypothetical protein n=1 Tax=Neobacillus drentensis TaxID=220684 RepID=UPI002FFDB298